MKTLALYRLTEKSDYYSFSTVYRPFKTDPIKRLNAFLIHLQKSRIRVTIWIKRINAFLIRIKKRVYPSNVLD